MSVRVIVQCYIWPPYLKIYSVQCTRIQLASIPKHVQCTVLYSASMLKIYSVQGYIQPSYLNIYSVQCTWTYPVSKPKYVQFQCIMYRIISGLYTKTCITYSVQGHIRSSNLNMYSVQCTVYSEQCTGLYPASIPKHVQCTVYSLV